MGVTLTDPEVAEFLATHPVATLITIGADGVPRPTPLWFTNVGATTYFSTKDTSPKVKNIRRDNRVVVQVETGDHYLQLKSVIIWGRASIVEDTQELEMVAARTEAKYADRRPPRQSFGEATRKHYGGGRVTIKVVPERMKTWDNTKLRLNSPAREQPHG